MEEHKKVLIDINIEKSDEAIESAEILLNNNKYISALNRIYYSMFYIVSALARKHDFITAKHTSLIGWFNKKYVHEDKIFDSSLAKFFNDSFFRRQENDYEDKNKLPLPEVIREYLSDAKDFIEAVRKEIFKDL